jgi:hypothetical protein
LQDEQSFYVLANDCPENQQMRDNVHLLVHGLPVNPLIPRQEWGKITWECDTMQAVSREVGCAILS